MRIKDRNKIDDMSVNISSSFMARTKCARCGSEARYYYYYIKMPRNWKDHDDQKEQFASHIKWSGKMNDSWYLDIKSIFIDDISEFSTKIDNKGFRPVLHRTRGTPPQHSNIVEVITCWCGHSWHINQKSVKNKPEIVNRKGKYSYPNKIKF